MMSKKPIVNYIYPLKLDCVAKSTLWGGNSLSERYNKPAVDRLGECWELSVREKERNIILNGVCKGLTINDYLSKYTDISPSSFPVLIKLIDARENLSVQVHPLGEKTELWHILEAQDDAFIILGLNSGVDRSKIAEAALDGSIEKYLRKIPVTAGETYFIPAGTIHAIGKGIVLAEIQQNSDTTYRFYDYGRGRELHIEQALENLINLNAREIAELQFSKKKQSMTEETLALCEYFTVIKHNIDGSLSFKLNDSLFVSLICTDGIGEIVWEDGKEQIVAGDSLFIPKDVGSFEISGSLKIITTTVQ